MADSASGAIQLQGIDLFLNLVEDADGSYEGGTLFNEAIFDRFTVEHFMVLFNSLLRGAVAEPEAATRDLFAQMDIVVEAVPPIAVVLGAPAVWVAPAAPARDTHGPGGRGR